MTATIKGEFQLDRNGRPQFVERGAYKHYKIVLRVENVPNDTYAVTYSLHETYYEPIRESRSRQAGFAEELTSYGDFTVGAKVRSKSEGVSQVSRELSAALKDGHKGSSNPEILEALKDIRNH